MLFNTSNNTVLASKVKIRNSFLSVAWGLMFQRLKNNEAMLLDLKKERNAQIHTLFLRHPIDVIWLNTSLRVDSLVQNIRPFKFWVSPKTKARYIVEMRPGSIEKYGIKTGDKLYILNKEI